MTTYLLPTPAFVPRIASGDIGIYDTGTMMEVQRSPLLAPEVKAFWLKWFPRTYLSPDQKIYFDEIDTNERRLAPFVAPNVQGRVLRDKGFSTKSFRPAYVKPKHVVDPTRAMISFCLTSSPVLTRISSLYA